MLISRLVNKGFSFDIAKDVVSHYQFTEDFLNDRDSLIRSIQKNVKTYSKKYTGDELKRMVLSQLVRKGFNSEDVMIEIEGMGIFNDESE